MPSWPTTRLGISLVVAVLTMITASACGRLAGGVAGTADDPTFDRLAVEFDDNHDAFVDAADRTLTVADANPEMERIAWLVLARCMAEPGESMNCTDTDDGDQALYQALPNVSTVVFQRRDPDRVFFRFNVEDPPVFHLMFAPDEPDPAAYAEGAGFRSHRKLDGGWTILGPIDDQDDYDAQFPGSR